MGEKDRPARDVILWIAHHATEKNRRRTRASGDRGDGAGGGGGMINEQHLLIITSSFHDGGVQVTQGRACVPLSSPPSPSSSNTK